MTFLVDQYGQGIHHDLPGDDYYRRTLGEVNKGALDVVDRTLLHYYHWAMQTEADIEERKTFTFGRALHGCVLEPDRYERDWVVAPGFSLQTKTGRQQFARWSELNRGKERIDQKTHDLVRAMRDAVHRHPDARLYVASGVKEATAVWRDSRTGLPCKARFDNLDEDNLFAADLKGVLDASEEAFARASNDYRYEVQHAQYCDGYHQIRGKPLDHFIFLCVEKDPPHAVATYFLTRQEIELGFKRRARNMDALARAMKENRFPSYNDDKTAPLRYPAYAFYGVNE